MAKKDIDALSGTETTGHEWDGIKELNTPLPRWWLWTFYATIAFSLVWTILFPAWPSLSGYTKGVLGYSSRADLVRELERVQEARGPWLDRFAAGTLEDVAEDPELLQFAMAGGRAIFADNCAPCHGSGGAGRPGYPILADDDWVWGGTLDDIHATIAYGVRSTHADARASEMPAFAADGILTEEEIASVADHVFALSGAGPVNDAGREIFADQCAACHGDDGTGNPALGAPNLANDIWLFGGSREEVIRQIAKPRHGVMPPWVDRLDDAALKQVTIYVHSLGGGQ